jgi:hypothetical protein
VTDQPEKLRYGFASIPTTISDISISGFSQPQKTPMVGSRKDEPEGDAFEYEFIAEAALATEEDTPRIS